MTLKAQVSPGQGPTKKPSNRHASGLRRFCRGQARRVPGLPRAIAMTGRVPSAPGNGRRRGQCDTAAAGSVHLARPCFSRVWWARPPADRAANGLSARRVGSGGGGLAPYAWFTFPGLHATRPRPARFTFARRLAGCALPGPPGRGARRGSGAWLLDATRPRPGGLLNDVAGGLGPPG